jgi:hypothetical protein
MELGGNMPGDLQTRLAEAKERKAIPAGESSTSNEDFELALPVGATREARQRARSEAQTKLLDKK